MINTLSVNHIHGLDNRISEMKKNALHVVEDVSYQDMLNSVQEQTMQSEISSFEDMWKDSFEKYFPHVSNRYFYHVVDVPEISDSTWQHNDFPCDRLTQETIDDSVFSWKPSRGNPSQLDARVQATTLATLGKNSIIVPPELDEKMRQDPQLAKKVFTNIEKVYEFHRPMPHMALPGTKLYGTKMYGSVIILNKDGEVEHSCVTSGGAILGPDEHTLRQIEQEQEKKQKRKDENRRIAEEAEIRYINSHREMVEFTHSQNCSCSISTKKTELSSALGILAQFNRAILVGGMMI